MKNYPIVLALLCVAYFSSCSQGKKAPVEEDYQVRIAVDETFRPIIEEEMRVFNAKYPEAIPQAKYMPETDAINLMLKDSVRMILSTRPLSQQETDAIFANYQLKVRFKPVGFDAIALIINPENPDSLMSVSDLRKIMLGQITRWEQLEDAHSKGDLEVVFDNPNSSTVRYVLDSICGGAQLKGNMKNAKSNEDVINYVAQTRNAIGIIGVDWLRNPKDSTNLTFNQSVRVVNVGRSVEKNINNCYQPVQYYIATGDYPLTRTLYMIITDPRTRAMGLNFYYFVSDQAGQLIITKSSQLLPYMPVHIKQVVSD